MAGVDDNLFVLGLEVPPDELIRLDSIDCCATAPEEEAEEVAIFLFDWFD
jgi:hypothetical protein